MNGHFELGDVSPLRYFFTLSLAIGLLFGLTSPDEQGVNSLLVILQWIAQSIFAVVVIIGCQLVLARIHAFSTLPRWWQLTVSGATGAVLLTPFLTFLDQLSGVSGNDATQALTDAWIGELFGAGPPIICAWLTMNLPFLLGYRFRRSEEQVGKPHSNPLTGDKAGILQQIPHDKRGHLLYLEAELHYVKVVTDQGASLVLYNLKDAVREFSADEGILCHRSFWVALNAIDRFEKSGRQGKLFLVDGTEIPVSRANMQKVTGQLFPGKKQKAPRRRGFSD